MLLDREIVDALQVMSLPLTIAAAYLGYIWPAVSDSLGGGADLDTRMQRNRWADKCTAYSRATFVLFLVNGCIVGVLTPLVLDVLGRLTWGGNYHTVQAGLVLVLVFLLAATITSAVLTSKLWAHAKELREPGPRA